MVTNDATILRLKHDVLYEVAKAAWEGTWRRRGTDSFRMIPAPRPPGAAVFIRKERLSSRESALPRANALWAWTAIMWSRSSMRPARSAHRVLHSDGQLPQVHGKGLPEFL